MKIIECSNWLRKPNPEFEGATPLETIERGGSQGARRVACELERLELEADEMFSQAPPKFQRKASKDFSKLDASDNRLASAIARGKTAHRKLVADEGGSFSAEEAAAEIGISKQAILKRYQKGQLIAWRDERQKAVRFPVWQFKARQVLNGIEETLQILNAGDLLDDFGRMLFFLSTHGRLGGKRPLDCLRDGEISKVTQAAQGYVE